MVGKRNIKKQDRMNKKRHQNLTQKEHLSMQMQMVFKLYVWVFCRYLITGLEIMRITPSLTQQTVWYKGDGVVNPTVLTVSVG